MMTVPSRKSLTMSPKLTFAILASVMLAACQKTDTTKSSDDLAIRTPDALIISAKNFFINDIVTTQSSIASLNKEGFRRHQVSKTPLWEKACIRHDDTKGDVVVVPLQYEKPLYFKTNFGNGSTLSLEKQSELWIYKDDSGKYKADVRITLPDKTYQDGTSKSFAGYLLEEDWTSNSIATYLYKNDKVSLLKKNPLPLNSSNTRIRNGQICYVVDWYECDYIENGIGYNCQYLYSDYISCDNDEDDEGGGGGGGGGSGTVYNPPECNMTTEEAQAALASITSTILSDGISESGSESGPDANGNIERPVVVKRHKLTYSFPGGKTATYTLYFPGVLFKTTTNSQWKWKSLTFSHIGLSEGNPGPCYAVDFTPALSLTIDEDKLNARFVAEITAKLTALCVNNTYLRTKEESLNGIYPSSDF